LIVFVISGLAVITLKQLTDFACDLVTIDVAKKYLMIIFALAFGEYSLVSVT
jgi:hypothetical protein